jgi:hypothetical protein
MKQKWEACQQEEKKAFTAKQAAYVKYQEARDQVNQKDAELKKIKQDIQRLNYDVKVAKAGDKIEVDGIWDETQRKRDKMYAEIHKMLKKRKYIEERIKKNQKKEHEKRKHGRTSQADENAIKVQELEVDRDDLTILIDSKKEERNRLFVETKKQTAGGGPTLKKAIVALEAARAWAVELSLELKGLREERDAFHDEFERLRKVYEEIKNRYTWPT